jgi:hypothetical protein
VARRHISHTRARRSRARTPAITGWALGALLGLSVLVLLAYLIGHGAPYGLGAPLEEVATTVTRPAVAVPIAFAVLTELAWCARHLSLEWLAWRPGRIEVATFSAATELPPGYLDQLALTFRRRLAELRLQSPTGVPGAVPQRDFLDVLGAGGIDSRNVLGSLLTLLRAAKPTHAYEVNGVVVRGDGPEPCGITVQVVHLPNRARVPVTVWGSSWEEAVRRAADSATAAILPHTRLCRDQWTAWRRYAMPEGLLHAYEEGARLEQDRRYDEALSAYYDALRLDPMNVAVRVQMGKLQEKLGLYLDAFSTYQGVVSVMKPGGESLPLRLYRRAARRQRRHAWIVARYRRVVLMGGGDFAKQWRRTAVDPSAPTERDLHREKLRTRLVGGLTAELQEAAERHRDPTSLPLLRKPKRVRKTSIEDLLDPTPLASDDEDRARYRELREVLALAALDALGPLRRRVRSTRRTALSVDTLQLTELCIQERLAWLQSKLGADRAPWPPNADHIRKEIKGIEGQTSFRSWHEHYNAACAYAVPLLDERLDSELRDRLAQSAVARLERATASADGAFVATRRDWLVSEDPDFNGLRTHPAFKQFEAMCFPAATPTPLRPRAVQRLESSRHVHALLTATASRWKNEWHRRGRGLDRRPDIHVLLRWWSDEYEAWRLVRAVAIHHRHWQVRLQLVAKTTRWGRRYDFDPLVVPFPRYEDHPLSDMSGNACSSEIDVADARLARLARALPELPARGDAHAMLQDIANWQTRLQHLDLTGDEPRRYFLAKVCDCHAGLWQLLEEWLGSGEAVHDAATQSRFDDEAAQRFASQIADARQLWRTAYDWWRPREVLVALALPAARRRDGGVPPLRVLQWSAAEWWRERRASVTAG